MKPRADSSAIGIHKLVEPEAVWRAAELLDKQVSPRMRAPAFMMERFIAGGVYHVNSLVYQGQVVFADASHYAKPPLVVTQLGGVSISHSVPHDTEDERALFEANRKLIAGLGLSHGTTHAEFIKSAVDGRFYFLEVGARVGGAHTAETLEAGRGINLWREWARIELAQAGNPYQLPPTRQDYSGSAVSLARQKHPDSSRYDDPEIVFRVTRPYHVGLVIRSPELERVMSLLDDYARRFIHDFTARAPQQERVE
jgi:biotin carboxylase